MSLCNSCWKFNVQSFAKDRDGLRGYALEVVRKEDKEGEKGCPFCRLLFAALKGKIDRIPATQKSLWIHMQMLPLAALNQKELRFNKLRAYVGPLQPSFRENNVLNDPKDAVQFRVAAEPESAAAMSQDIGGRYLGEDARSDEQVAAINHLIAECISHEKCNQTLSGTTNVSAKESPLPRRCIDVEADPPVLKEPGSELGTYITLTHRWTAETESTRTTQSNCDERKQSLPLESLPKLFRDAIWLTKRLGVRYLWIDSLCIIQKGDDGQESPEWNVEAPKMANYYQHSIITIATTSSDVGLHGLFPPFVRSMPRNIVALPYRNSLGKCQGKFYVYQCNNDVRRGYAIGITFSELLSRGWVFQEFILSRRIVCYTEYGVFFQCQSLLPRSDNAETVSFSDIGSLFLLKSCFDFQSTSRLDDLWYEIVQSYSKRRTSEPHKDRILALSGIAKEFREALRRKETSEDGHGLEYVSGLWLRDIHHGLLWYMVDVDDWRFYWIEDIPSWSWGSRKFEVEWPHRAEFTHNRCQVLGLINERGSYFTIGQQDQDSSTRMQCTDVDIKFTSLLLRCQTQKLLIRGHLKEEERLEIQAVTNRGDDRSNWRAVCSLSAPTVIVGWAEMEEPAVEHKLRQSPDGVIFQALHVSTESADQGGIGLGYLTPTHEVLNVLFILNINKDYFIRVGIGKIYGKDFIKEFHEVVEEELVLK